MNGMTASLLSLRTETVTDQGSLTIESGMEGIHMLRDLLKPGDWMTKVNFKDAYFMIPIAQEDREFLHFSWKGTIPIQLSSFRTVHGSLPRPHGLW